ncbi:MAG: flagellin [Gemmatimonas sp.]
MSLSIISNYAANVAHRYLENTDMQATNSVAKLSAGTRVLTAKDDAASLAIGSRLAAEVAGQKQAQVNATQATSMLQVADGAMSKVNDILVRMKTLAVQAGSGQLGSTERSMLDTEYQSLISEIDRIATATTFNGVSLVNGSSTTSTTLNGQAATPNVVQAADGFDSISFGNSVGNASVKVAYDATAKVLTLTNMTSGVSQGVNIGSTAISAGSTQTVNFSTVGATIVLNSAFDKTAAIAPTNSFTLGGAGTGTISAISVTGATYSTSLGALATQGGTVDATNAAAALFTIGAFTGSIDLTSTGTKSLTMSNAGSSFTLKFSVGTAFTNSGTTSAISVGDLGSLVFGQTATSNTTSFSFKLGTGTTANVDDVTVSVNAVSVSALGLTGTSVTGADKTNADTASTAISAALNTLNTARAGVGAAQNRLQFASDNLATSVQNSEAARSSLMDLDMASEMTKFTSAKVLEDAGISMLAQANQLPQSLMKLFQ